MTVIFENSGQIADKMILTQKNISANAYFTGLAEMIMSQFWKKDFLFTYPKVHFYVIYNIRYYDNFSHFKLEYGSSDLLLFHFLFPILDCFIMLVINMWE